MGEFLGKLKIRRALKEHRCTYCAEQIHKEEAYWFQKGHNGDAWFSSKLHEECLEDLSEGDDGEYTPYMNDRPTKESK
jgi:hypothetical protein